LRASSHCDYLPTGCGLQTSGHAAQREIAAFGGKVTGQSLKSFAHRMLAFDSFGKRQRLSRCGFTVVELIVAMTILMILTAAAVPIVRVTLQRGKERELRRDLWEMRDAIDRYKDAADRGAFQVKVDSQGYPPDLDTLVKGIDSNGKKMRFLRRIPVDPMTGTTEWGLRSMQDESDSDSWGGQSVFDVYTKSEGTALDGSKYKTW
jgi:general secretion pathway protein G